MLGTTERREKILDILRGSDVPVSAAALAEGLGVSRQIIVGDVAILRAAGASIASTPRGYIFERKNERRRFPYVGIVAVRHTRANLAEELYTIVDFGGTIIDVVVDHPIYGQLVGNMDVASRHDADLFMQKAGGPDEVPLLCSLTAGIHMHHVGTRDEETFILIKEALTEKGFTLL